MKVYIFDMDGTFIDSMDYWNNLMDNYLKTKGLDSYEGLQTEILNMPLVDGINHVRDRFELDLSVEDIENELKQLIGYNYKKVFNLDQDAREIFEGIKNRGDKLVLATATQRSLVDLVLERFDIKKYFDLEIVSDETDLHKDDSEYFVNIANHFDVEPNDCTLVEDALYSIKSGKEIGMNIVGITAQSAPHHLEEIKSLSDAHGKNLGEVKDYFLNNEN